MKNAFLLLTAVLFAIGMATANEKYQKSMGETISLLKTSSSLEDFQDLANRFRVVANVEKAEWLPLYYEAQCYIFMSFMDTSGADRKDSYLDVAQISIEKMLELAPAESEAHALQALYYTGRLVVNPAERSQTITPLYQASIGKAMALDADNPRARYVKLTNDMGTARFFGNDITPMCEEAHDLLEQWDSFIPESPIHPVWGKNQVQELVRSCDR